MITNMRGDQNGKIEPVFLRTIEERVNNWQTKMEDAINRTIKDFKDQPFLRQDSSTREITRPDNP